MPITWACISGVDDILDEEGTTEQLGKDAGSDREKRQSDVSLGMRNGGVQTLCATTYTESLSRNRIS